MGSAADGPCTKGGYAVSSRRSARSLRTTLKLYLATCNKHPSSTLHTLSGLQTWYDGHDCCIVGSHRQLKMSGELPPLYGSSHDIHGAYCVVSAVAWACVTGIVAAIRFVLAWQRGVKFGRDDITFAIAAVSGHGPF